MSNLLTIASRTLAAHLGTGKRAASPLPRATDVISHLVLTCPQQSNEDSLRADIIQQGQKLVRQEAWDEISTLIREADAAKSLTPAGMPLADLLAYGARADVIAAAEHTIFDRDNVQKIEDIPGIRAMEYVLNENSDAPMIAGIVAQIHIDVGWAYRGLEGHTTPQGRAAFASHFNRASEILAPFDMVAASSPFLSATNCALMIGRQPARRMLAQQYERLIDLDPNNPGPMRALGTYLLPRWGGDYQTLELEARRTAARHQNIWGAGGYVWIMCSAMSSDPAAASVLDTALFAEGLEDIIERHGDQHTLNWLAACCATIEATDMMSEPTYEVLCETVCTLLRDRLSELHSLTWAHAVRGFDNKLSLCLTRRFAAMGREMAENFIRRHFKAEIALGMEIHLTTP